MEEQLLLSHEIVKDFLNSLTNQYVRYSHVIRHPAFEEEIKTESSFVIKKILFGELESNSSFSQVMIANTFNSIFVISSIAYIELSDNSIVFYIDDNKNIFYELEILDKELKEN